MNEIARRILDDTILSVEQADEVCRDLVRNDLTDIGVEHISKWTFDLALHYITITQSTDSLIQIAGWKAAAKAYQSRTIRAEPL